MTGSKVAAVPSLSDNRFILPARGHPGAPEQPTSGSLDFSIVFLGNFLWASPAGFYNSLTVSRSVWWQAVPRGGGSCAVNPA